MSKDIPGKLDQVESPTPELLDYWRQAESLGLSKETLEGIVPVSQEIAPSKLVVTLSYAFLTGDTRLTGSGLPLSKLFEMMGCLDAATVSSIAPGMAENKLISITSQDFAGEMEKPPRVLTRSKSVEIQGPPMGNYTIKLCSKAATLYLTTPMGGVLLNHCTYPSIKIEGGGSVLVQVDYPRLPGANGTLVSRQIEDTWMFVVGA